MARDVTALRALAETMLAAEYEQPGYPEDQEAFVEFLVARHFPESLAMSLAVDYGFICLRCRTTDTCYHKVTRLGGVLQVRVSPTE